MPNVQKLVVEVVLLWKSSIPGWLTLCLEVLQQKLVVEVVVAVGCWLSLLQQKLPAREVVEERCGGLETAPR